MWRRMSWLLVLLPAWVGAEEIQVSYAVERFLWEEFDNSGHKLLDESGFRHRVALHGKSAFNSKWQGDVTAGFAFGSVDYEGQTQSGVPVSTDTDYRGYGLEAGIGYFPGQLPSAGMAGAALRLALGLDGWERSLQGAGGYNEEYRVTYGRLAGVYLVPVAWRLELGVKLPLAVAERVDLSAYGYTDEVNLSPKGRPSLYLTWHYQISDRLTFSLDYDGYLFDKSDDDVVYNEIDGNYYAIHQPRSEMQTLGLAITLSL
ncbi:MAG: hypothetical protein OQL08_05255 [Gammaproteobacteria bacterium]|nr:hypothetical protein [Gammaproteobacteria bacterium]